MDIKTAWPNTNCRLTPRFSSFLFDIFARSSHILHLNRLLLRQHYTRRQNVTIRKCIFLMATEATSEQQSIHKQQLVKVLPQTAEHFSLQLYNKKYSRNAKLRWLL